MDETIEYDAPDMVLDIPIETLTYEEFNDKFQSQRTHDHILEVNSATLLAKEITNCTVSLNRLECIDYICLRQPVVDMGPQIG